MSKLDAQRAMREAKYARIKASGPSRREAAAAAAGEAPPAPVDAGETPAAPAAGKPAAKPPRASKKTAPVASLRADATDGERCGHKSMNGRACTRDAGHSEKSHRYG